jgi:hypothetical protein
MRRTRHSNKLKGKCSSSYLWLAALPSISCLVARASCAAQLGQHSSAEALLLQDAASPWHPGGGAAALAQVL